MPIDPNIILSARPTVALQDPLERYGKLQALQNGIQQQQINAQQLQSGALDLQAKQRDYTGQQALSDAIQKNMTAGPDGTPAINHAGVTQALGAGGNGRLIPGYMTGVLAQQKAQGEAQKLKLENATSSLDLASRSFAAANDQAGWDSALATAHGLGIDTAKEGIPPVFSPENKAAVIQKGMTIKDNLAAQSAKLTVDTKALAEKRDQAKEDRLAPGEIADATQKQVAALAPQLENAFRTGGPDAAAALLDAAPHGVAKRFAGAAKAGDFTAAALTPEQTTTAGNAAATLANTKDYQSKELVNKATELRQGDQRIAMERARVGIEQKKFEATFGSGLDANGQPVIGPDGKPVVSPQAQAIADGTYDATTTRAILRRMPGLISQVKIVDPGFTQLDLDKRQDTLKQFTNTTAASAGGQALALNTVIHHADLYMETAKALRNGTFKPGNAVYNAVASVFGSAPPQNAALVARFFASETGKVASGGVPAEGEINGILKNLGTDAGPDQIEGAGKTLLQIAAGRATPLQERVDDAKLGKLVHVLGPDAQAILARRGFDPQTMKPVTQPAGQAGKGGGPTTPPKNPFRK